MKKVTSLLCSVLLFGFISASSPTNSSLPSGARVSLISSNIHSSVVKFSLSDFSFTKVETSRGVQDIIELPETFPLNIQGAPDLNRVSTSLIIPDHGSTSVSVLSSHYKEYENVDIAPSKGIIYYGQNADKIPYEYGPAYSKDEFFPGDLATARDPHIMRNVRGEVIDINPFQYNPVKRILRVYSDITVEIKANENERGINNLDETIEHTLPEAFNQIYSSTYINYNAYKNIQRAATPMDAPNGRMLIICYDAFQPAIQPFADWKTLKGIETEVVKVSVVGTTSTAIKTYITNYYNSHADFTYLVLVGDHAQVPSTIVTGSETYASDTKYIQITGSDIYPEVICGRISAEKLADVTNQVTKFMTYEKTPNLLDVTRFNTAATISLKVGPDNSTLVYKDMRAVKTTLTPATYTCTELFESSLGDLSPTAANINATVNKGQGFMSWISHGYEQGLASFPFTNSSVAALTNTMMWPMIWNCSCVTGKFYNTTCFSETWLRASNNGKPVGAIGCAMSTRNMPMGPSEKYGNDAAKRIVDPARKNQTYGALTYDTYLKVAVTDYKMSIEFNCMVIMGDPSLVVRTKAPMALAVTHSQQENMGVSSLTVNSNVADAYIALTQKKKIIGTGYIKNGTVQIAFPAITTTDTIFVTGTEFNYAPYLGYVLITPSTGVNELTANDPWGMSVYSNSTRGIATVNYYIPEKSTISMEVYDMTGKKIVDVFSNKQISEGRYEASFDIANLKSGQYFCRLAAGNQVSTKKFVVAK